MLMEILGKGDFTEMNQFGPYFLTIEQSKVPELKEKSSRESIILSLVFYSLSIKPR